MHEEGRIALHTRLLRFLASGMAATMVHVAVAGLLATAGFSATSSNAVAFVTASGLSYMANCLWTFGSRMSPVSVLRFATVSLVSLAAILSVSAIMDAAGFHPFYAIALVAVLIPALSFVAHNFWTFR